MEMKSEADSNDISAECSHDEQPSVGMCFFPLSRNIYSLYDFIGVRQNKSCAPTNLGSAAAFGRLMTGGGVALRSA